MLIASLLQRNTAYDNRRNGKNIISWKCQRMPLQSNPKPRNDNRNPPIRADRTISIFFQLLRGSDSPFILIPNVIQISIFVITGVQHNIGNIYFAIALTSCCALLNEIIIYPFPNHWFFLATTQPLILPCP